MSCYGLWNQATTNLQRHLWKILWTNHKKFCLGRGLKSFYGPHELTLAVTKQWIFSKSDICQECNSVNCCKVALWWLKCCIAKSPQKSHKLCVLGHHRTATQWVKILYEYVFSYFMKQMQSVVHTYYWSFFIYN